MGNRAQVEKIRSVSLTVPSDRMGSFYPLLQQGLMVRIEVGVTLKDVLCRQLGLTPEYVEERIQTIFLNGKAVDDISRAVVMDGDTVALSAAMPGLVGATFRKGGFFAGLRLPITHKDGERASAEREGMLRVKLFNLLIDELGPQFLQHGVWIETEMLGDFLKAGAENFGRLCAAAETDGVPTDPDALLRMNWKELKGPIYLRVVAGDK
jgi:hypothetical protein